MPNIVDVIIHGPYYQISVVIDVNPKMVYERKRNLLVAEDDGFWDCLAFETPSKNWQAFGGRKFDILMKDGSVEHAHGQWWAYWATGIAPYPTESLGIATLEDLRKCYVFCSGIISTAKLDDWLSKNTPSTDYYKYDRQHEDKKGD